MIRPNPPIPFDAELYPFHAEEVSEVPYPRACAWIDVVKRREVMAGRSLEENGCEADRLLRDLVNGRKNALARYSYVVRWELGP